MHYFYVLYSMRDGRLYKGYTSDIGKRFLRHNSGGVNSTCHRRPLVLLYLECYETKEEAMARERWSKSRDGGPELRVILTEKGLLKKGTERL